MSITLLCRYAGTAAALFVVVAMADAAVITSSSFSLGFGFSRDSGSSWNTDETAGVNTPTTIGDFSFTPAPTGPRWSGSGATFVNRVLADGTDGDVSAYIDDAPFALPITASYNGAAPTDADGVPNYKLRVEISSISIYAGAHPSSSLHEIAWDETTPGHAATSPALALTPSTNYNEVAAYGHLVWDPDDFDVPLASLNDSTVRTFDILGGNGLRYGDGIEVTGTVSLVYDAVVPEPASLVLLALGGVVAFIPRRAGRGMCAVRGK